MPVKKILVVDDSPTERHFMVDLLTKNGFQVVTAESGEEGVVKAKAEKPDLIIMDIYLKGEKNGLELAREIQAREPIPILFLTASTKPEIVEAIHELKDCQYLSKPINADSLEDMLQRYVRV